MSPPSPHDVRALRDARTLHDEHTLHDERAFHDERVLHDGRSLRDERSLDDVRALRDAGAPQDDAALRTVRELGLDLLSLIWPTACVGCGAADRDCCDACLWQLEREVAEPGRHQRDVHVASDSTIPVLAAGTYDGVLRSLLIALKHRGQTGFARPLGRALSAPLREALDRSLAVGTSSHSVSNPAVSRPLLVCVPSRPAKLRERGYHHVELIVRHALRSLAVPQARSRSPSDGYALRNLHDDHAARVSLPRAARLARVLRPLRGRTGQVGLSAAERERNAAQIAVRRSVLGRVRGRRVILIDDIMTSGATLRAACNVLIDAGAAVDAVVVLGVVDRADEIADGRASEGEYER